MPDRVRLLTSNVESYDAGDVTGAVWKWVIRLPQKKKKGHVNVKRPHSCIMFWLKSCSFSDILETRASVVVMMHCEQEEQQRKTMTGARCWGSRVCFCFSSSPSLPPSCSQAVTNTGVNVHMISDEGSFTARWATAYYRKKKTVVHSITEEFCETNPNIGVSITIKAPLPFVLFFFPKNFWQEPTSKSGMKRTWNICSIKFYVIKFQIWPARSKLVLYILQRLCYAVTIEVKCHRFHIWKSTCFHICRLRRMEKYYGYFPWWKHFEIEINSRLETNCVQCHRRHTKMLCEATKDGRLTRVWVRAYKRLFCGRASVASAIPSPAPLKRFIPAVP